MTTPLRLLLIEDSPNDAELLLRHLHRGGFQLEARRVETARELDESLDAQTWDLVLSDHSMPGFDGLEALQRVIGRGLDLPFIFVSGTLGEETAVRAMKLGARDYIMKDNLSRLVPAIRRELDEARLRRERRHLEQRMHNLERFEALGKLAGGIAHDFNNALCAILGWAELGANAVPPASPASESFRQILEQSQRAAGLTRQLLAYARKQVIQPRVLDLNLLINQTASLLKTALGPSIEMKLALASGHLPTRADPSQIDRVLMNLCLNARDAMPDGGVLRLETSNAVLDEPSCAGRRFARPGSFVLVSVVDTGVGIEPAVMERLFEPFFTTKPEGQGTGLGLATSLGIVNQHGGFIDVSSRPGQGSVFQVYLPSCSPEETSPQAPPATAGGAETVLVVDDHDGMRELIGQMLESHGYRPLLASSAQEALERFSSSPRDVALSIIDVNLPDRDGFEVYRSLSLRNPALGVIFISGGSLASVALHAGGKKFLQKPFSFAELLTAVRALLDRPAS